MMEHAIVRRRCIIVPLPFYPVFLLRPSGRHTQCTLFGSRKGDSVPFVGDPVNSQPLRCKPSASPISLTAAHENCSLPIRSHGRRFLRQFRAHPRNGRRSPAPRRRFGRIFRTLRLRLSAPGPPLTPPLPPTQSCP